MNVLSFQAARRLCLALPVAVSHPEWETTWTARNIEEYLGEVLREPVTVTPEGVVREDVPQP
jgi:hypothetical protein